MIRSADRRWARHLWLSLPCALLIASARGEEGAVDIRAAVGKTFDASGLRRRGLDPQLAEHFVRPVFPEGAQPVTLFINGAKKGSATARFTAEGELCMDRPLLQAAGLQMPDSASRLSHAADPYSALGCDDFSQAYPNALVELKPNAFEVHLIVPTQALVAPEQSADRYHRGGTAALLNYEVLTSRNDNAGTSQDFKSLNTLAGINMGDWLLRSRQNYSDSGGEAQVSHLYAYGQRTFSRLGATGQAGQINVANSLFSGTALNGVQLVPESSSLDDWGAASVVEGIAHSVARVEIRQNGTLVHTAMVPAGPFAISDLQLLDGRTDLEVTVIEANGSQNAFVVPGSHRARAGLDSVPGYSMAVGQYRRYDRGGEMPLVLTASRTWALNRTLPASVGALLTADYQAGGWGLGFPLSPLTQVNLSQLVSSAAKEGQKGTSVVASVDTLLTERWSIGASTTQQTRGYRQLSDTLTVQHTAPLAGSDTLTLNPYGGFERRYRDQYSLYTGLSNIPVGSFYLSHTHANRFDGQSSQRVMGSWAKNLGAVNLSLSVSQSKGVGSDNRGLQTNLSLSFPLGERSVRSYANSDKTGIRSGASMSEQLGEGVGYSVHAEHNHTQRETDLFASAHLLPRYVQATLGYSRYGQASTQYSGGLSGAIVAHAGGVTLSPYAVDDTFGLISVPGVSGAKITTPRGPVWTDVFGQAVAPSLAPYKKSQMTVITQNLPRNVEITNGVQDVQAGKGSVSQITFEVMNSRRVLVRAIDSHGKPLAKGLSVFDSHNQFLTIVIDDGNIYLPQVASDTRLHVALADNQICSLDYEPGEQVDFSAHYESAQATCKQP
ncbi:fimbria/pilus outer membrane usher protein [Pseudomonas chlororaphis]|uniref:fimbria/pilus outer membrane usher protein n=1 Tax=Pseudomonas chlororaphis TaxID=587753 RepID=UPI00068B71F8|nr:fimbria/pilus outer membrane usher protein [Pseudomonas chlororaphis]